MFADIFYKTYGLLTIHATAHILQDMGADMLQRQIDIMTDLGILTHQVEQFIREAQRIAIMQTNPFETIYVTNCFDQFHNMGFSIKVVTIIRQILSNENQLFHALFCQLSCFFK